MSQDRAVERCTCGERFFGTPREALAAIEQHVDRHGRLSVFGGFAHQRKGNQ